MMENESRLRKIVGELVGAECDINEIDFKQDVKSMGINSINFVKLVVAIEAEFDFEFGDSDLSVEKFANLESILNYINERTNI